MADSVQALFTSLTYPPAFSLCLLAFGMLALLLRRRRTGAWLAALALGWSFLWSLPQASHGLRGVLENRYPRVADEAQLPEADAIVVLGGGYYGWLRRQGEVDPWQLQRSRVAAAARAWYRGRAPLVILSGNRDETDAMARAMVRLGVPDSALLREERSRDTRDNSDNTAALARKHGFQRMLLVTSSLHMPRASLLFRQAGIDAVPVPVPEDAPLCTWQQRWIPSRGALWRSGRAWKEYAGLLEAWL